MADVDAPLALAAEFPPADRDDWLALAGDVERLRTTTYDGITIEPLYTAADRSPTPDCPASRRSCAAAPRPARERLGRPSGRRRQRRAGARPWPSSNAARRRCGCGSAATTSSTSTSLDARARRRPLRHRPGRPRRRQQWPDAARALRAIWERARRRRGRRVRILRRRPVRRLGRPTATRTDSTPRCRPCRTRAVAVAAEHPNVRVATIDGTRFHDAGASDAQELGDTLAVVRRHAAHPHRRWARRRSRVRPARGASRRHRRAVRHDRQVPRRPSPAGTRRRGLRRADRRRWRAAARRHVTGDVDPLRPCRQHRAGDDRLLRRGRRRRRRHHRAAPRRRRSTIGERAGDATGPQHADGARRWSRTSPG